MYICIYIYYHSVAPDTWHRIRLSLAAAFRVNKDVQIAEILHGTYGDTDIIFLQEAAGAFAEGTAGGRLGSQFDIWVPASCDRSRDQNSLILARRGFLAAGSVVEVTEAVLALAVARNPAAQHMVCVCVVLWCGVCCVCVCVQYTYMYTEI